MSGRERGRVGWEYTGQGRHRLISDQARDPRVWNRKEYVRLERDSFSIFMDSLPGDISKRELFDLFSWTGRINDIYLARKMRNGMLYLFAFIRYTTKGGALKAIAEMNCMKIRGKEIFVRETRYRRDAVKRQPEPLAKEQIQKRQVGVNPEEREHTDGSPPSLTVNPPTHAHTEGQPKLGAKGLGVSADTTNLKWLQRSVIGSATDPIDFSFLNDLARKVWPHIVRICELGNYTALLIFDSVKSAEEALEECGDGMRQSFHNVCRWNESDRYDKRRVWIECHGVPLHVWTEDTFRAIGAQWGEVVVCDNGIAVGTSFRAGRMLIDTWRFEPISESLRLSVGSSVYEIFVKKVGSGASGSSDGLATEAEKGHDGMSVSNADRHEKAMKMGGCDTAEAEVAMLTRPKEVEEGRIVTDHETFDEWSNSFLNSNTVTERETVFALKGEMADLAEDMSKRTQS
ncbi:hypothetical protein AHAS_Ahas12G0105000 [Arachis hypogaea]